MSHVYHRNPEMGEPRKISKKDELSGIEAKQAVLTELEESGDLAKAEAWERDQSKIWVKRSNGAWQEATVSGIRGLDARIKWLNSKGKPQYKYLPIADLARWQKELSNVSEFTPPELTPAEVEDRALENAYDLDKLKKNKRAERSGLVDNKGMTEIIDLSNPGSPTVKPKRLRKMEALPTAKATNNLEDLPTEEVEVATEELERDGDTEEITVESRPDNLTQIEIPNEGREALKEARELAAEKTGSWFNRLSNGINKIAKSADRLVYQIAKDTLSEAQMAKLEDIAKSSDSGTGIAVNAAIETTKGMARYALNTTTELAGGVWEANKYHWGGLGDYFLSAKPIYKSIKFEIDSALQPYKDSQARINAIIAEQSKDSGIDVEAHVSKLTKIDEVADLMQNRVEVTTTEINHNREEAEEVTEEFVTEVQEARNIFEEQVLATEWKLAQETPFDLLAERRQEILEAEIRRKLLEAKITDLDDKITRRDELLATGMSKGRAAIEADRAKHKAELDELEEAHDKEVRIIADAQRSLDKLKELQSLLGKEKSAKAAA